MPAEIWKDPDVAQAFLNLILSVSFSKDAKVLASGCSDDSINLWDIATGNKTATFKGHNGLLLSVVFSPDGKNLASCGSDGTVKLWDVASGKITATLIGHTSGIHC